jgi:hypothetical protein
MLRTCEVMLSMVGIAAGAGKGRIGKSGRIGRWILSRRRDESGGLRYLIVGWAIVEGRQRDIGRVLVRN